MTETEKKPTTINVILDTGDGLTSHTDHIETIATIVEKTSVTVIPFAQFFPLIRNVDEILNKVIDLYKTAQHNKNTTKILMERIIAANSAVNLLQAREDLFTSKDYVNLQRLVQVLQKMKKFIEEITQYNTVQKIMRDKSIEK